MTDFCPLRISVSVPVTPANFTSAGLKKATGKRSTSSLTMQSTNSTPPIGSKFPLALANTIGACIGCFNAEPLTSHLTKRTLQPKGGFWAMNMPAPSLPSNLQPINSMIPSTVFSLLFPTDMLTLRLLPIALQPSRRIETGCEVAFKL